MTSGFYPHWHLEDESINPNNSGGMEVMSKSGSADELMVFLTDGTPSGWIGPYLPGDLAIARGTRTLRENHDAADVWVVRATDLDAAKEKWSRTPEGERGKA